MFHISLYMVSQYNSNIISFLGPVKVLAAQREALKRCGSAHSSGEVL